MSVPSHITFRLAILFLALLLSVQSIWLLLSEFSRPSPILLPINAQAAAAAAQRRSEAALAARIGAIRGTLWAESAFTYADLLWAASGTDQTKSLARARAQLDRALDTAPHQADAWLLLAGLALRYHPPNLNATAALKMSYYTGLNEAALMPLRLLVAVSSEAIGDTEVREFVRRDLRLLLARQQKFAVNEAYEGASPAGRRLIEETVREIDPSSLGTLRPGAPGL